MRTNQRRGGGRLARREIMARLSRAEARWRGERVSTAKDAKVAKRTVAAAAGRGVAGLPYSKQEPVMKGTCDE